jgi:hypothetical protein
MDRPKMLAYYFPDWHQDPRNAKWFGQDWDEWKLLLFETADDPSRPHRQVTFTPELIVRGSSIQQGSRMTWRSPDQGFSR